MRQHLAFSGLSGFKGFLKKDLRSILGQECRQMSTGCQESLSKVPSLLWIGWTTPYPSHARGLLALQLECLNSGTEVPHKFFFGYYLFYCLFYCFYYPLWYLTEKYKARYLYC